MKDIKTRLGLTIFYREPSEFSDGDKAPGHEGWKVEIALDKTQPEVYKVLCYTNSGENPNDQLETFYESCSGGVSSTIITAQDYDIPFEAYLTKGATTQDIYGKMLKPGDRMNIGIKASNSLMNIQKTFKGVITISGTTTASNAGMKMTGTIKHFSGGVEEGPIDVAGFTEAVGSVVLDTTDTNSVSVLYDLTLNDANPSGMLLRIKEGVTIIDSVQAVEGASITHTFTGLIPITDYTVELYNSLTGTVISSVLATTL